MVKILSSKLVGGVFIIAAILKLISIDEFEIYIYSFNIFSFLLTTFVSRIIIIGEFILGLFLILKINYKFTWRISLLTLTLFTLFLTYTAIFRQDANCHCFGELIELSPLESIIKNVILILLLLLSQKTKDKRQKALSEVQSSKFFVLCSSFFVLLVFIISPPDSIYKMLYSTEKEVSSIDLYESFDEVTKIVIGSSGCKYCKLGMKKLSLMMKKEELSTENVDIFIWGSPEGIVNFRKETMTEDYDYWHIMPNKAIEITYGRFPIFIWIKEKDIIKVGDFRDLDDACVK